MQSKIWLSSPHMGGTEINYIQEAFNENWIAPLGPNVNGLETDLERYLGESVFVATLNSGTSALHLGLIILGIKPGDEVICQSMTFSATVNPILYLGAIPVFVDSEEDTWNMCPVQLEIAIIDRISKGVKPKAIMPVHLYGMPANMPEILRVAAKYEIPVLEDAAEALGSTIDGQKAGTFGSMAALSFNGNKIITTSGGGALVAREKISADRARFLATQARDEAPHYQHSEIGYNYRMSNISAGIGRGQMEVLDNWISLRRRNYAYYKNALSEIKGIYFLDEPTGYFSNRWLTAITIDSTSTNGINREDIRLSLLEENIESRPLWKPMHLQPIFAHYPAYLNGVSEKLFDDGLCLPSGSNLKIEDLDRVINKIREITNPS